MVHCDPVVIFSRFTGVVCKVLKSKGKTVRRNEVVAMLKVIIDGDTKIINIENDTGYFGTIIDMNIAMGSEVTCGETRVMSILPCSHPAIFNHCCVACGDNELMISKQSRSNESSNDSQKLENDDTQNCGSTVVHLKGGHGMLKLSAVESTVVATDKYNYLKENRKLALVLDIDHTLLHCIMGADKHNRLITPEKFDTEDDNMFVLNQKTGSFETAPYVHKAMEAHCHTILLSDGSNRPPSPYTVKIRPYLTWMLNELTRLYQITLYTNGTRAYAEAVAAVIDPDNSYFNKRIVARTDMNRRVMPIGRGEQDSITDFSNYHAPTLISSNSSKSLGSSSTIDDGLYDGNKSLKLLYLNATSLVVIVDDKADVWGEDSKVSVKTNASAADNLLLIKPYIFFKGDVHEIYNRDDNRNNKAAQNTNAVSASVTAHVEQLKENDDILVRYCSLLKNIHSQVYSLNETVPSVIKILKSSVLKGCCISFSGLIPRKGSDNSYFIGHPLYKLACSLGAKVIDDFVVDGSNAVSEKITHLVCNKDTDKLGTSKYFYCVRNYKCNGVNSLNSGSNNEFVENRNCVHLVSVEWLTACRHFCEHVSESAFHVPLLKLLSGNGNKNESVSNIVESNIKKRKLEELVVISGADDSDSDDFNEWANEL